jgi:arylformamidase
MTFFSAPHPAARWALLNKAERDTAYNNGAAVADSALHNKARNEASAAYRAAHAGALDLPYGTSPREAWDIYPGSDPAAPCFVFIHGGYWQMNGRENFAGLAAGLAAHGWSVAMPGYTIAPEGNLGRIADEVYRALDWLAEHGPRYGAGSKILVSGWSAGGQLAALALAHPAVRAGLALSGVYELAPIRDTYLNQKLALSDHEIETLSPLRLPVIDKPLAIAYGTAEVPALVEDSRAFHARRAAAHAPGALLPIAKADHFTILDEIRRPDGLLVRAALDLAQDF